MTYALLTIGTELTRGDLFNTNASWLAAQLSALGHEVTTMLTVDDDDERLTQAIKSLVKNHECLICTGGLGPTSDDLTTACAAQALNLPLERDADSLQRISERLEARGLKMTASNEKQALLPRGSTLLGNTHGTAPGFAARFADCLAVFMPGVPAEMRPMFQDSVVPLLRAPEHPVATARLRTMGTPEAQINDRLSDLEALYPVSLGYRASNSEIEVKVQYRGEPGSSTQKAQEEAEKVADVVAERLADAVYARGQTTLAEELGRALLEAKLSFGLAESCTGGLVSHMLTKVPGSSRYYWGGICSYDNRVKQGLLDVPKEVLQQHGAVSQQVVELMARGARRRLGVDVALALSGIAGPGGGSADKPIGLVHWAIADEHGTTSDRRVFAGDRLGVQKRAAIHGLWRTLLHLRNRA